MTQFCPKISKLRMKILRHNEELKSKAFQFREAEMQRAAQEKKQDLETQCMTMEDFISGLPIKTIAPTPNFRVLYNGSVYINWNKVSCNSRGQYIDGDGVIYQLYVRGGYFQPKSDTLAKVRILKS